MAAEQPTSLRLSADHSMPMSSAPTMSPADVAAHRLASYVRSTPARTTPGDSDPDADEALRRARSPRQAVAA